MDIPRDYWFDSEDRFLYYSGPQSMAFFSYEQSSPMWDYAEEYVLADYFAPVMGVIEPNRIAYLVGHPPSFYCDDASDVCPFNESVMYQLSTHNVSWGYFVYDYQGGVPWSLTAFQGASQYQSHYHGLTHFLEDLRDGGLPSVSWVMFPAVGQTNTICTLQHDLREEKLVQVMDAVMESHHWSSSVIFVTFHEGGYYDQVTPPAWNNHGLGQRIPLLVISPYSREAFVDNYTMSGYTLLGFIDYNWNLPYITPLTERGVKASWTPSTSPWLAPRGSGAVEMVILVRLHLVHYGYVATEPQ